jgi:catechol 2,3-dioxygenase-like lactoylglutathione lyase family enzyme
VLAQAAVIGFVPVGDMAVAERFYAGVLGLRVIERGPYALVVASESGSKIRCALTPGAKAQPFTVLGWEVPEIHAAVNLLRQAKIEPIVYPHFKQDQDGVWAAPGGGKVAWFHDPDGNVLSISQVAGTANE